MRCREIGHNQNFKFKTSDLKLFIDKYNTIGGEEYFLSFEDKKRNVVLAFLRLRLPNRDKNYYASKIFKLQPEIKDSAFIRELHTYGQLISLKQKINKTKKRNEIQTHWIRKSLVTEAEKK